MPFQPKILEPHVNWRAADVSDPRQWTVELTGSDHRELDAALAQAKSISIRHNLRVCQTLLQ